MTSENHRPQRNTKHPLAWLVFISTLIIAPPLFAASKQSSSNTLLILDGSGSMWGKIKDGHKVTIARQALSISLAAYNQKLNLGLMAYGHRRRAACNDIEVLKQPSPLNRDQFSKLVKKVKPVGKTPITAALQKALPLLNKTAPNGNIILLTDGPENCRRDPCALVKNTKTNNIAIHVIAFAMQPKDAKTLHCLAKQTGGQFLTPNNKQQLITALKTALNASSNNLRGSTKPELSQNKALPPGLKLTAHLSPTTKALQNGLSWTITPINNKSTPEPIFESQKPTPFFPLTAGQYRITTQYKGFKSHKQLSLTQGEHKTEKLILNLAEIQMPAAWGQANSRSGFGKLVLEPQHGDDPASLITLTNNPERKLLPAGPYKVSAVENGRLHSWLIQAEAGKTTNLPVWKNTGRLKLNLTDATTNTPLDRPLLHLKKQQTKAGAKNIKLSTAQSPQFDLEAGTYHITIKDGHAQKIIKTEIAQGKTTDLSLSLARAHLTLQMSPPQNNNPPTIAIHQLRDKTMHHLITTSDLNAPLILSPGTYRLTLITEQKQASTSKTIKLKAGDKKNLTFKNQTTPLQLRISNRKDPLSRHQTFWQIFSKTGHLIWQSTEAEPNLNIPPGRYKIQAEIGQDLYTHQIRISGTKTTTIDLAKYRLKK